MKRGFALAAIMVVLGRLAIGDDQGLIEEDLPAAVGPFLGEAALDSSSKALKAIDAAVDQTLRNERELDAQADLKQRDLDDKRSELSIESNAADLNLQTIKVNREKLAMLDRSVAEGKKEKESAAADLKQQIEMLYLSGAIYSDASFDPSCQFGDLHRFVWRPAAQHAAYRFQVAEKTISSADSQRNAVRQAVLSRQARQNEQDKVISRLKGDIGSAEEQLAAVEAKRHMWRETIPILRVRHEALQQRVADLLAQKAAKENSLPPAEEGADQSLIEPEEESASSLSLPSSILPFSPLNAPKTDSPELPTLLPNLADPVWQEIELDLPGVEIDTGEQPRAVYVAIDGEVLFADELHGFNKIVVLDHGESYSTVYAYLGRIFVEKGDRLRQGDVLGMSGRMAGKAAHYGVRFEARHLEERIDPWSWNRTPKELQKALIEGVLD